MFDFDKIPKFFGTVTQIQIEQNGQEAALVFAVKSPATEEKEEETKYFVNPFHGDPVVSGQVDLLRDAMASNKVVRIAYEKPEDGQTPRMVAVRIQSD